MDDLSEPPGNGGGLDLDAVRAQFGPLVRRLVWEGFPDPPYDGFLDSLADGILRNLIAARRSDLEPRIHRAIRIARLILRHNQGVLAVEELVMILAPDIQVHLSSLFPDHPRAWEIIQDQLVERISRDYRSAERAAEFPAFIKKIAVNLLLDRLRKGGEVLECDLRSDDDGSSTIEDMLTPTPSAQVPELDPVIRVARSVQFNLMRLPFMCPPNPPHQSLTWGYSELLGISPKRIVAEFVDLSLATLLAEFRLRVAVGNLTKRDWGEVTRSVQDALMLPVGATLLDPSHRRIHAHLLDKPCGETCLRDYRTAPGGVKIPNASPDAASKQSSVLAGNLSDWSSKVRGRFDRGVIQLIYSLPQIQEMPHTKTRRERRAIR